ncbi:hypothetical protein [Nonomuraea sp. NPDC050643]|uniref:hypothetical protein n=1 Tax=Nonomuraea sp. NPDC050643 TaxID=3155660 RepID=UPI00340A4485
MTPYGPQDGQPYPQQPPNPYQQHVPPQQPYPPPGQQPAYVPASHAAPRPSQGLAIVTLILGLFAAVLAFTPLRGVGLVLGFVAVVLAIVVFVAKTQGGTLFAAGGLALGMVSLPIAFFMWTWATESAKTDVERQKALEECITKNPEKVLECAGWN